MAVLHTIFVTLLVVFFVERSYGHLQNDSQEDDGFSGESVSSPQKLHIKGGGFIKKGGFKGGFKGGKGKFGTTFISKKGFSAGHFRDAEQTPSENPPQAPQSSPETNEAQQRSPENAADIGSAQLWQMPYSMHQITDPREMRYGWVYQVDHNEPAVGRSYQLQGTPQHLLFRDMDNTISDLQENTMDMNRMPLDPTTNFRKVESDNLPHPEASSKPDASITSQIRQTQNPSPAMMMDSITQNQPTQFRLDMPQIAPPEESTKPPTPLEQDMSRSTFEQGDSEQSKPENKDTEGEQNPMKQLTDVRQVNEERQAWDNTAAWARSQVFQACNPGSALRQMTQQEQMPQQIIIQQQMPTIEHIRQMPHTPQQQMPMSSLQISGLEQHQQPSIEQRQSNFQQQQQMPMQNQQMSGFEQQPSIKQRQSVFQQQQQQMAMQNQQLHAFEQQQPTFEHRQMPMMNQQMPGFEQQQTALEHRQMTATNQQMPMINQQMSSIQQQQPIFEHRQMPMSNQQMPSFQQQMPTFAQQQSTFQQPGVEQRFMLPQQQIRTSEQQMPQQQPNLEVRMEGAEAPKLDQVKMDEMHAAMEAAPEARHFHHKKKHGHLHQNIYITVPSHEQKHYGVYGGYAGGYGGYAGGHGGYSQAEYGHGGYGHKASSGYGYVGAENPGTQEPSPDTSSQPKADPPAETATNSRK